MAAAASQLCVRQASTFLDCFIHHEGCKVEQISPLFHLYLYLFFKFRRAPFCSMPTWHAKYCTDIYLHKVYGSRLMAKEEKSTFQISSLLLSSFISNIYVPDHVGTLAQVGNSSSLGWPSKELRGSQPI